MGEAVRLMVEADDATIHFDTSYPLEAGGQTYESSRRNISFFTRLLDRCFKSRRAGARHAVDEHAVGEDAAQVSGPREPSKCPHPAAAVVERSIAIERRREAPLIIVCGLAAEAKIARGPGLIVIQAGTDRRRLAAELEAAAPRARGIISFGVAGGVAPGLKPGDVHVAQAILSFFGDRFETDQAWSASIARELGVSLSTFIGVDAPLGYVAGKAAAHRATGAAAVDMESHLVAEVAARHGLPMAAVRVITDSAEQSLPHAATVGMRSDGGVDLPAILRSILKNPRQVPRLIRTGLDARAALESLLRCRQTLGPGFALTRLDLGEPRLNMA